MYKLDDIRQTIKSLALSQRDQGAILKSLEEPYTEESIKPALVGIGVDPNRFMSILEANAAAGEPPKRGPGRPKKNPEPPEPPAE